ncbi:MAG: hypothetical protein U5L09_06525 [Bacteroidales bacterium]|nr:hypothetical protein [Bacteroidales bacterium]
MDSSIITGISTLLAVGLTLFFTTRREKYKFIQDLKMREYNDLESFYTSLIASLEKTIRYTERGENYKELLDENSIISAKANLISTEAINEQLRKVSDVLYEWSSYYRKSLPTKFGETGYGFTSNIDMKHKATADKIYPTLHKEIGKLIELIKLELTKQKKYLQT